MIQEDLVFFVALQIKCPLLFCVWGNGLKAPPSPHTLKSVLLRFGGCHPLHCYSSSAAPRADSDIGRSLLGSHWISITTSCVSFIPPFLDSRFLPSSQLIDLFPRALFHRPLPSSLSTSSISLPGASIPPLPSIHLPFSFSPPSPSVAKRSGTGNAAQQLGGEKKNHIKNIFFIKKRRCGFHCSSTHGQDLKTPGSGLITSRRTFVTGCSKGSWKILNHCEKLGFDGPRGGNQCYYRAGDAICNNRQKHGD